KVGASISSPYFFQMPVSSPTSMPAKAIAAPARATCSLSSASARPAPNASAKRPQAATMMARFIRSSPGDVFLYSTGSLEAQRVDRIETRRTMGGIIAEKDADRRGSGEAAGDGGGPDDGRPVREIGDGGGGADSDQQPRGAAHGAEQRGL